MASARIASIRRCSLEKVFAPTDSKNWLGRMVSGSELSIPSSKAIFFELFRIAYLDPILFRHIAIHKPSPCDSSCPTTIADLILPNEMFE